MRAPVPKHAHTAASPLNLLTMGQQMGHQDITIIITQINYCNCVDTYGLIVIFRIEFFVT